MKKYIVLYADRKQEDNILITNMFKDSKKIKVCWTEKDSKYNMKLIKETVEKEQIEQIIFLGLETGWDNLIEKIKLENEKIIIKVICNTLDSLLYNEYERNNFFRLLELSKRNVIEDIAFLRKGQYETYKGLGYKCSFLLQNYILPEKYIEYIQHIKCEKKELLEKDENVKNSKVEIGIYPLEYTWDKNIFNQLCIAKYLDGSKLKYNCLNERMSDFINKMDIEAVEDNIEKINEEAVLKKVNNNNINISCSFTEYLHTMFFLSFESGVPCLIGNNSDLFDNELDISEGIELEKYIVTKEEDDNIENSKRVNYILENINEIMTLYRRWKEIYNKKADKSIQSFLEK